jgi:hypothetical protein
MEPIEDGLGRYDERELVALVDREAEGGVTATLTRWTPAPPGAAADPGRAAGGAARVWRG